MAIKAPNLTSSNNPKKVERRWPPQDSYWSSWDGEFQVTPLRKDGRIIQFNVVSRNGVINSESKPEYQGNDDYGAALEAAESLEADLDYTRSLSSPEL